MWYYPMPKYECVKCFVYIISWMHHALFIFYLFFIFYFFISLIYPGDRGYYPSARVLMMIMIMSMIMIMMIMMMSFVDF